MSGFCKTLYDNELLTRHWVLSQDKHSQDLTPPRATYIHAKTWPSQGRDSETLEPGQRKPQKCLESKVQCSYPQIKVHGKISTLCQKFGWLCFFLVVMDIICIFLGHRLSHRTQNLMRNAEEEEKPTCVRLQLLGPELATESTLGPVSESTWGTHMREWHGWRGPSRSADSTGPWTLR